MSRARSKRMQRLEQRLELLERGITEALRYEDAPVVMAETLRQALSAAEEVTQEIELPAELGEELTDGGVSSQ